jgi:hypothetical protein
VFVELRSVGVVIGSSVVFLICVVDVIECLVVDWIVVAVVVLLALAEFMVRVVVVERFGVVVVFGIVEITLVVVTILVIGILTEVGVPLFGGVVTFLLVGVDLEIRVVVIKRVLLFADAVVLVGFRPSGFTEELSLIVVDENGCNLTLLGCSTVVILFTDPIVVGFCIIPPFWFYIVILTTCTLFSTTGKFPTCRVPFLDFRLFLMKSLSSTVVAC